MEKNLVAEIAIIIDPSPVGAADFNGRVRAGAAVAEILGKGLAGTIIGPRTGFDVRDGDLEFDAGAGWLGALPEKAISDALFAHIKSY